MQNNGGELSTHVESEVIQIPHERGITLFGTENPIEVVQKAQAISNALSDVIERQGLYKEFKAKNGDIKKHVLVDAWTLCGTMLGVFPVAVWTRPIENGFEARVEARLRDGSVVGGAEAMCSRAEANWERKDDYALRSMAQTRATSKALRLPLGFIVAMGGYSTTPAEEMMVEREADRDAKAPPSQPAPERKSAAPKPAPTTPRATRPTPIPESAETITVWITEVKELKSGETNGEAWTLYAINGKSDAGVRFDSTTFDYNVKLDAENLTNRKALVHFMAKGKYKTALAVSPATTPDVDPNDILNEAAQS